MRIHDLKIAPPYYAAVVSGDKTFEVRYNDRDYQVGDILNLNEYLAGNFTGRGITKQITYMLDDADYCKEGFIILALADIEEAHS